MMASASASCSEATGSRDEIKTQFSTREGMYRLITLSDCLRPSRVPQNGPANMPVRLSFISLGDQNSEDDRICFNIGKELYFYQYAGIGKVSYIFVEDWVLVAQVVFLNFALHYSELFVNS